MFKTNINAIPENGINRSYRPGVSIRYLVIEEFGAPNFEMRYFELEPGTSTSDDFHESEHEVFIVRGRGFLHLKDQSIDLKPEDAILIEPWEPHRLESAADSALGFLCIVPNGVSKSKHEVEWDYGDRVDPPTK